MSTSPRVFEVPGQSFSSMHDGLMKPSGRELIDQREVALTRIFLDCKNPKQKATLGTLLLAREEQNKEIDKLFESWKKDIALNLARDHEAAQAACLEHLKKIEDAEGELQLLQGKLNDLAGDVFKRESHVATAIERRNSLSPYSSKSTIQQAEKNVVEAEARLDDIQSRCASLEDGKRQIVLITLPQLKQELQRLTSLERCAASAITGEPFHDESGLILPPGTTF